MFLYHHSDWTFDTSAGGGIGIGIFAMSGGLVRLKDPAGNPQSFYYAGIGGGLSEGLKIPKLPKITMPKIGGKGVGGAMSTTDFPSYGVVYRKSVFAGQELTRGDIQGATIYFEGGAGLIAGISGSIMFFGMNRAIFAGMTTIVLAPVVGPALFASSTGVVIFGGANVGYQAGGGIAGLIGTMT